jgi:hypothetical protein
MKVAQTVAGLKMQAHEASPAMSKASAAVKEDALGESICER